LKGATHIGNGTTNIQTDIAWPPTQAKKWLKLQSGVRPLPAIVCRLDADRDIS